MDVILHNNLHAPISVAVMESGKHCYCEKPMAGSYVDAVAMKEAAARTGMKLHIQLARLYGAATECAKKFIDTGRLGKVYHSRSYGYRRRGRPFVDGYAVKEFNQQVWAGHGALYDMGVYHVSQLLYLLGTPKVARVSGSFYQELAMERREESGFDVEELAVGLIKFEDGSTLDIIESWAIHGGEFPSSSIHGSEGGLRFEGYSNDSITYYSEIEGYPAVSTLNLKSENYRKTQINPDRWMMQGSQAHWVGILRGEVEPIDTVHVALQTMLVSEGIFLSHTLGREVTGDEIPALCKSNAMKNQETPFGILKYKEYPFV